MVAKELSIFLENKSGRLTEVTEVLAKENINLSALCIAENADFGILRVIVSDPDRAYKALKDNHFAVNVTDVVGISCPNVPGALAKVLGYLSEEGVFIEYMYSFANNHIANVVIVLSNSRTTQLLTVFTINIVTLPGEDSDGICQRYRHYPEHIPSLL